jgi:hypothetical protein
MTEMPYRHFKTIPADQAATLSFYLNTLLQKVFKSDFQHVFTLLDYYPATIPSYNTTYSITQKNKEQYIGDYNRLKNFFGFNTFSVEHDVISHFIGRTTRLSFDHLLTGKKATGIQSSKVETDMAQLLLMFFSGKLDYQINMLSDLLNKDF